MRESGPIFDWMIPKRIRLDDAKDNRLRYHRIVFLKDLPADGYYYLLCGCGTVSVCIYHFHL